MTGFFQVAGVEASSKRLGFSGAECTRRQTMSLLLPSAPLLLSGPPPKEPCEGPVQDLNGETCPVELFKIRLSPRRGGSKASYAEVGCSRSSGPRSGDRLGNEARAGPRRFVLGLGLD